jgi:hypothetical protein
MLTEIQTAYLTQGIRDIEAKRLLRERKLYREGVNAMRTSPCRHVFAYICCERVQPYHKSGELCFYEIQQEEAKARDTMGCYSDRLSVDIGATCDCDNAYSDAQPYVAITYSQYSFSVLAQVKISVERRIRYTLGDAKFKLANQPNGKDTKMYLSIIEEAKAKHPNKFS